VNEPIEQTRGIDTLVPHPRNYNQHPPAQIERLAASLQQFGQVRPIVVHRDTIIAGHGVYMAAQHLGYSTLRATQLPDDWTDEQAMAYLVTDNETRRGAEPDDTELAALLDELQQQDFDIAAMGFDEVEYDALLDGLTPDLPEPGSGGDEFEPDDAAPCRVQAGDVWLIGGVHRLICGDCTEPATVDRLMQGERAELGFTSPPYADQRTYDNADVSVTKLIRFFDIAECPPIFIVNLGIKIQNNEIVEYWQDYIVHAKSSGYKFLSWGVWDRGEAGTIAHNTAFLPIEHEWIFVFGKQRVDIKRTKQLTDTTQQRRKYHQRTSDGKRIVNIRKEDGSFEETTTYEYDRKKIGTVCRVTPYKAREGIDHPAMFPIDLPIEYIDAMTDTDDLVYDPFLGSGTTIIAAHRTGRRCYGCEISPEYCEVILQRCEAEGLTVERVSTAAVDEGANGL
jgi:DNA modification methylase